MHHQVLKNITFIAIFLFIAHQLTAQVGFASYQKGNEFYEQKKYKEAINLFSQAIDSMNSVNPKPITELVKSHNNRGNAYGQLDNLLLALFDYDKAIELDKKLVESYMNRANIHTLLRNFTKAIADLNKAIQLNPKLYEAYYQRGLILLLDIHQNLDAAKDLKLAAEKLQTVQAITYYAQCLQELNNYVEALAQTNKAIAVDKNYAEIYYIRAIIFRSQKDKAKALTEIEKALKIASDTPEYKDLKVEIMEMK
jgi:tetratricopeptide (TPR) repeat protein